MLIRLILPRNYVVQDIDQLKGSTVVVSKTELLGTDQWISEGVMSGE